ncbi:MAG TPA: tetratricopeptide repeat protein [Methylibium sp.]|nr:tetratricopeptide repeat protein [Methylibium sp.]
MTPSPWPARIALLSLGLLLQGCATVWPAGAGTAVAEPRATPPTRPAAMAARPVAEPAAATATPDNRQTYLAVIEQLSRDGQHYAAYAHLQALEARHGGSPEVTLLKADALRASGDTQTAATLYGALLDTPLAARAYHGLGLIAGARQDFATAALLLDRAATRDPTHAGLLSDLGYALLLSGRPEQARRPLLTAAELAPQDARIQANLALYRRSVEGPAPGCAPNAAPTGRGQAPDPVQLALGRGSSGCAASPGLPRAPTPPDAAPGREHRLTFLTGDAR